jgi:RHS repeat-associated protein
MTRHDYLPFGEELFVPTSGRTAAQGYVSDSVRQHFTSQDRDTETGLDYFLARYYSSTQGRFTSVDPENKGANPDDPQSWNGYAYARNNPLLYSDPDGREYTVCDPNGKNCVTYSDRDFEKLKKGGPADGYTFKNGNIYYNGELTATYSNDCLYCGQLINEMGRRASAIEKGTVAFAATSIILGTTGGYGYYLLTPYLAPTVTTLELSTVSGTAVSEGGLASFSIQQLNGIIRGTQKQLLNKLFGQGMKGAEEALKSGEVPKGLTKQTLMVAKEIAKRQIARGLDSNGVQAVRLKIVEEALKRIK